MDAKQYKITFADDEDGGKAAAAESKDKIRDPPDSLSTAKDEDKQVPSSNRIPPQIFKRINANAEPV